MPNSSQFLSQKFSKKFENFSKKFTFFDRKLGRDLGVEGSELKMELTMLKKELRPKVINWGGTGKKKAKRMPVKYKKNGEVLGIGFKTGIISAKSRSAERLSVEAKSFEEESRQPSQDNKTRKATAASKGSSAARLKELLPKKKFKEDEVEVSGPSKKSKSKKKEKFYVFEVKIFSIL